MCSCKLHCISRMQRFIPILIGHIKKCHRILSSEWPMSIASMLKLNLFYHFPCKRQLSIIYRMKWNLNGYLRSIDANNLILFDKIHYRKIECAYSSQRLVLVVPIQMDKINTKLAFYIVSFKSITVPTDDPFSTFFSTVHIHLLFDCSGALFNAGVWKRLNCLHLLNAKQCVRYHKHWTIGHDIWYGFPKALFLFIV